MIVKLLMIIPSSNVILLRKTPYSNYIITRGYEGIGAVDPLVCSNLRAAQTAGTHFFFSLIQDVHTHTHTHTHAHTHTHKHTPTPLPGFPVRDVYLFTCPKCTYSADIQVKLLVGFLNTCRDAWTGRIWLDIENTDYWKGVAYNRQFFTDLVTACERSGANCGIYSSAHMWSGIFGADFVHANYLPMWYASYDSQANLKNWAPFGGWSKPYAKQYGGDPLCGITVDVNVSPNSAA